MKKLIALLFLLVTFASAQNYSTVSGTAVLDKNGNAVTGTIEFVPDREFGFVGGAMACCNKSVEIKATVTAGSFSGLLVPRKDRVNPAGVCFTVLVKDATGNVVLGPDGYRCVQPTGASYDFGTYTPLIAATPNTPQPVYKQDCSLLGVGYVLQTINPDGTSKCVLSAGGGGSGTWGTITGTLSSQSDLNTALGLKAPLASPTFSGTVTAPTVVGNLTGNASGTAGGLSSNIVESQVTNLTSDLALKAPIASPTFTGTATAPTFAGNLTGNVTGNASGTSGSTTGNAATATAFDHTPTLCSAGNYPLGILASGAATNCTAASGAGTVTHTAGALTAGQIALGNGSADITVGNLSGDVTTAGGTLTTAVKANGNTFPSGMALGDTLYGSAANAISKLAGATTLNGVPQFYQSQASGGVATAPFLAPAGVPVDPQSGSSYTAVLTDRTSLLNTTNNTTSTAVAVPQSGTTGFANNFAFVHCNPGSVAATDTPATSTVNGNATLVLQGKVAGNNPECAFWWSDNTNYFAAEILPTDANGRLQAAGMPAFSGDVTSTAGTINAMVVSKVNGAVVPTSATVTATNASNQIVAASVQGNGTKVQLSTGSVTTQVVAKFDANGNTVNSSITDNGTTVATTEPISTSAANAGAVQMGAGTAQGHATASTITDEAPAAVTAYENVEPGTSATGFRYGVNASAVRTESFGELSGDVTTSGSTATTVAKVNGIGIQRVTMVADWTCGTGGTSSTCVSATIIGTGGTPLTITLPSVAASYNWRCDGVVGQATAATANSWNFLTATNGATNVTASYQMNTAATAMTGGATTDQAAITTTVVIGPTWTLGGTATKMPFHIQGSIEGASASGTVLSLQLVAPTVADLVTIYRGATCSVAPF